MTRMVEVPSHSGVEASTGPAPVTPIAELQPDERADEALKKIHRALLRSITSHQDGVREVSAGEYLHDFRVAVRRTRTGLRQLKRVYPGAEARRSADGFRWVSETTSTARDLEVFLASVDPYRLAVGSPTIDALASLWEFLRESERAERGRCTAALESERYRSLISEWSEFLDRPAADDGIPDNAGRPIREVAVDRISRAYARLVRRGSDVEPSSPADAFHRLRLDCKKLRYLLEFFCSLFEQNESGLVIASLRRMQNSLGSINDLRVQAVWIERAPGSPTEAGGVLSAFLHERQREERSRFVWRVSVRQPVSSWASASAGRGRSASLRARTPTMYGRG